MYSCGIITKSEKKEIFQISSFLCTVRVKYRTILLTQQGSLQCFFLSRMLVTLPILPTWSYIIKRDDKWKTSLYILSKTENCNLKFDFLIA